MRDDLVQLRRTLSAVEALCGSCADALEKWNTNESLVVATITRRLREVSNG